MTHLSSKTRRARKIFPWAILGAVAAGLTIAGACVLPNFDVEDGVEPGVDAGVGDGPVDSDPPDVVGNDVADAAEDGGTGGNRACDFCRDETLARPPCKPDVDGGNPPGEHVYAVRSVSFGFGTDNWKTTGLDLDCLYTLDTESRSCGIVISGTDGEEGRDNAVGSSGLMGQGEQLEAEVNQTFEDGERSIVLVITKYSGEPDDDDVDVVLYEAFSVNDQDAGVDAGSGVPRWDGTDTWNTAPDPSGVFDNAFVTNHVVVARSATLVLTLGNDKAWTDLIMDRPVALLHLSENGDEIEQGTMAGIWLLEDTRQAILDIGRRKCFARDVVDGMVGSVAALADIRVDRIPAPDDPCQAISMGLALTGVKAQRFQLDERPPGYPEPVCEDGGTDAGP